MNINRTQEPAFNKIEKVDYIKAHPQKLDNGIDLYTINVGEQEVLKIDFLFEAGDWMHDSPLVSDYTANMLQEGTQNYTSEELAEKLDFMGAYVYYSSSKHSLTVSAYTLVKHVVDMLGLLEEILKRPLFPEQKFSIYNGKKLQQYIIENQKVEVIAQQQFSEALFGVNHPYGRNPKPESFEQITINDLIDFHENFIRSGNCRIIASGKIDDITIAALNKYFGGDDWQGNTLSQEINWIKTPSPDYKQYTERPDAVQSAIRIGKEMVNKYHKDYPGLQFLNTVLGGFFGSRLMTNIREDKGYTYGIGSGIISQKETGYFVIVSQVGKNVRRDALKEIYFELDRLQSELIPEDEVELVRNYMMGTILRNFDGAFALSDSLKSILEYDLDYSYYDNFIKAVKNISSTDLQALAIGYFKDRELYEIVTG